MRSRQKSLLLLVLALVNALAGGIYSFVPNAWTVIQIAYALVFFACVCAWCTIDASDRGQRVPVALYLLLVFCTVFALPLYFLRSRGLKGGVIATLRASGLFVGLIVIWYGSVMVAGALHFAITGDWPAAWYGHDAPT